MRLRNNLAHWINRTGNVRRALRLYSALLPYQARFLAADHPDTLVLRNNIAEPTGRGR